MTEPTAAQRLDWSARQSNRDGWTEVRTSFYNELLQNRNNKSAKITLQFERNDSHAQGAAQSKLYGPFEWVQFTYRELRVGENGEITIASFDDGGYWRTDDDNQTWSDIIIGCTWPSEV